MRRYRASCFFVVGCLLWAPPVEAARAAAARSRPVERKPPSPQAIAEAIRQLGHPRYRVRQEATELLWRAGKAAEAALRGALASSDPEVVARAQSILEKFRFGIYGDTPAEVLALISRYREGNLAAKQKVITKLIEMGGSAFETALALIETVQQTRYRDSLRALATEAAAKRATSLLIDGDHARAERELELAARAQGRSQPRNFAAYLLLRGRLDETIRRYASRQPLAGAEARVLAFLYRARGDLAAAAEVAKASGSGWLLEGIQYEKGDWQALARLQAGRAQAAKGDVEILGYLAAYHRLAGNDKELASALAAIRALAGKGASEWQVWYAAEALLLNDRPGEAVDLLVEHKLRRRAAEILATQDRFERALRLLSVQEGKEEERQAAARQRAKLLWRIGKTVEARRVLSDLSTAIRKELAAAAKGGAAGSKLATAVRRVTSVLTTQSSLNLKADARQTFLAAMPLAKTDSRRGGLLGGLYGSSRRDRAVVWWNLLSKAGPQEALAARLKKLDELLAGRTPVATLRASVQEALRQAAAWAESAKPAAPGAGKKPTTPARLREADNWRRKLGVLSSTCADRGEVDLAIQCSKRAAELSPSSTAASAYVELGDLWARKKQWTKADPCYDKAWQLDPSNVSALYLWGWALGQAGRKNRARKLTGQARLLALGDSRKRMQLIRTMARLGLTQQAKREVDCIARTAALDSRELGRCVRRWPRDVTGGPAEATLLERGRLVCLRKTTAFIETRYYLTSSVRVHLARARAHVARGEFDKALAEADVCRRIMPSHIDTAIELAGELDERGRKREADRVFQPFYEHARGLCKAYPQSGEFHNRTAWLAVRSNRELAAALAHAKRAVALHPQRDAYLDTLAEVHFVRGERERAIALIQKCLEMSPGHTWYIKQLKRFRAESPTTKPGG